MPLAFHPTTLQYVMLLACIVGLMACAAIFYDAED